MCVWLYVMFLCIYAPVCYMHVHTCVSLHSVPVDVLVGCQHICMCARLTIGVLMSTSLAVRYCGMCVCVCVCFYVMFVCPYLCVCVWRLCTVICTCLFIFSCF